MGARLFVVSGAGLSAESGLATFRDTGGIWSQFNLDEVCNYRVWRRNRAQVFDFYAKRKEEVRAAQPNEAHAMLAAWQKQWGAHRVHLLTQNVDDLLERAGAEEVTHLHGELTTLFCDDCYHRFFIGAKPIDPETECPCCGRTEAVKPGVVFFGEMAPQYHKLHNLHEMLAQDDILLVVGSSMQVIQPGMMIPAWRIGHARNWQVNPAPAEASYFGRNLAASASEGLPQLEPLLTQLMGD